MKDLVREVQAAEEELLMGNVILYPTDTVWGIGCDAHEAKAVQKVFKIKERDPSKSMIILVADIGMVKHYVENVPDAFEKMLEEQEQPTTYIFEGAQNLPEEVIAPDGTIAIRVVKDEFCHKLIRQLDRPLVSTSANLSGGKSPATFADIDEEVKKRVDYVVRWRQDEESEARPSRIVKIKANGEIETIRE
ncbi:threonylcarbamoyl-AMP synthase [Pontibacter sp. BT310]|jgi:L-threonylcarbamoyladenylate synthase|uniref:L-threonylcarbamoyladenylate synthase n=1 Tax=Pontibacter populi TaxID=890055 RepID=A0ABS6XBQ8_9BACT|nr:MULTISPECIES: L-threonylcarbamoyladenylate synthase [Pontibacter]MBJ6118577.1 threonylcarbamoyl-AMP synthase [Pontibacter sp. BT310]MBR0571006.1 threonylcarbamoyl-AMP synthase [Microvirga sp. STS03]MBW3365431.1 threonylcarbamoyl-AMP synthase [Pontibacter populi]